MGGRGEAEEPWVPCLGTESHPGLTASATVATVVAMPRRSAARALTLALLVAVAGGIPLHSHDAAAAAGPASPAAASTGAFPAEGQSVASGLASKGAFPIEGQSAASGLAARRGGGGHVRGGAFTAAAAERHGVDWLSIMERLLKWRRNGIQPGPEFDFVPQLVGSILPGASLKWDAPCFSATSAVVRDVPTQTKDGAVVTVTIELQGRTEMICEDAYLLATPWRYLLLDEAISGSHVEKWGPMTRHGIPLLVCDRNLGHKREQILPFHRPWLLSLDPTLWGHWASASPCPELERVVVW